MAKHLNESSETPSLVLVGVPDKAALEAIIERLKRYGIHHETFHEPDYDLGLTAIATYPITHSKQRYAMRMYPLWTPKSTASPLEVAYAA